MYRDGAAADDSVADLLQQNKGIQEAIFASLYTLTKNRSSASTRRTAIRIVVEFLQVSGCAWHTCPTMAFEVHAVCHQDSNCPLSANCLLSYRLISVNT